jgi:hypothetical protein
MAKKKVKRFDVWVTRHDFAPGGHQIRVSNVATTDIKRIDGCTIFHRCGRGGFGRDITKAQCLKRYGSLPRPGECWNVWNTPTGRLRHELYPILEKYRGTTYKPKTLKVEKKHYL